MTSILDLLDYWLNHPNIWFGSSPETDQMLTKKYGYILDKLFDPSDNPQYNLGLIVLWDQISRHVYRKDKEKIVPYHKLSLSLSLKLLNENIDEKLKSKERCFLLMPLRHTFDISYLEMVIDKIRIYMNKDGFEPYRRFYRATMLSYSKLVTSELVSEYVSNVTTDDIVSILDDKSCKSIISISNPSVYNNKIYKQFNKFVRTEKPKGITISISGGVDSMICSYVLYHIRKKYPNITIVAVMVNYNNRNTCNTESKFVAHWLQSLDIPLYVRHIKYLRRKNVKDLTDRKFYEAITKEFRFDLYRRFEYPVVLGHNKDDTIENIFTNIRKGRNYDNLRGMRSVTTVDNIIFSRPMLDITKAEIYDFARNYEVPFLVDSTPSWSDRGKIRDSLIPFLNEFDPVLIPGLIRLSEDFTEIYQSQNILVNRVIDDMIIIDNVAVISISNNEGIRHLGFDFWKQIIRYICNHLKINMCSNKSIYTLIRHMDSGGYGKTNLSKHLEVSYKKHTIMFYNQE